jgi:glycine/D-amino acid oxidase-like deaminating enzyme
MPIGSTHLSDARIVVVGAGAVGSVLAYRLAQAGANVTLVDRRYPGSGTTGNSFAWLNSFGKSPREYHRLNVRSIRDHEDLQREISGNWAFVDGGLTWEHEDDEPRRERLRERARRLHQLGYRIEELTPQQVMTDLEPDLLIDPDRVETVYYTPNEGWLNGVGMCHSVASAAAHRYGATYLNDEVVGFGISGGGVESVQLAGEDTIPADAVVNAAGPATATVASLAGVELPIDRQPGLLVSTEPAPVNLKAVVHGAGLAIHPDGGWRLLLHGEDYDALVESGGTVGFDDPFVAEAMEEATRIVPNLKGIQAEGLRVGVRPMPKDGLPIIGFDPDVSGLYHTVMHSGVTLSAAVGLLVTEEFSGVDVPDLAMYRPTRFTEQGSAGVFATAE